MKLVMTLLVRDEEDILPSNIEFHLRQGVDFIIATDNRSCDATSDILHHYEQQGVLQSIFESSDDYSQHRWVTRMARLAFVEHGADWVINNDADEFWWEGTGRTLKERLAATPTGVKALSAERVNFVPRSEIPGVPFYETMRVREARSVNAVGMPLLPKVCHRGAADISVAQGNHAVDVASGPVEAVPSQICIFHYPLRTYRQFSNKIAKGGRAYESNSELPMEVGVTWRHLFEVYKQGGLEDYYDRQVLSDDAIESGLSDGSMVEDRRLADYLREQAVEAVIGRWSGGS